MAITVIEPTGQVVCETIDELAQHLCESDFFTVLRAERAEVERIAAQLCRAAEAMHSIVDAENREMDALKAEKPWIRRDDLAAQEDFTLRCKRWGRRRDGLQLHWATLEAQARELAAHSAEIEGWFARARAASR